MHTKFMTLHSSEHSRTHCTGLDLGHSIDCGRDENTSATSLCGPLRGQLSAARRFRVQTRNVYPYAERVWIWLARIAIAVGIILCLGRGSYVQAQGLPDLGGAARSIVDAPGRAIDSLGRWWNGLWQPPPPPPRPDPKKTISNAKTKKRPHKLIKRLARRNKTTKCKPLSTQCSSNAECCSKNCQQIGNVKICN
jgi:hypothetical protein